MNIRNLTLGFGTLALAVASAASSYSLNLATPVWIGQNELKPGSYTFQVEGEKVVFKTRKETIEVPVTVEKAEKKYGETSMNSADSKLKELKVGGTNMKLVFQPSSSASGAAGSK
jgi:hypothetical protein